MYGISAKQVRRCTAFVAPTCVGNHEDAGRPDITATDVRAANLHGATFRDPRPIRYPRIRSSGAHVRNVTLFESVMDRVPVEMM